MQASEFLYDFHTYFEGKENKAYRDTGGVLTIGIGHTSQRFMPFTPQTEWSDADIKKAWRHDIKAAESMAIKWLDGLMVPQVYFDALVDLAFNVGQRPRTLLNYLWREDYEAAEKELLRWVYCQGKVLIGLVKRRFAMYKHIRGEPWDKGDWLAATSKNPQTLVVALRAHGLQVKL